MAYDPASDRVVVGYQYAVGPYPARQWQALASYDLTSGSGGRSWFRLTQVDPDVRSGFVQSIGFLPGRVLVRGIFPIDDGVTDEASITRFLALDAADGSIVQRWSTSGEQDAATGELQGPASACETSEAFVNTGFTSLGDETLAWVSTPATLCRYGIRRGSLTSDVVSGLDVGFEQTRRMPSIIYATDTTTAPRGLGRGDRPRDGDVADWDPAPAMRVNVMGPTIAALDGSIVLGGEFSFARGIRCIRWRPSIRRSHRSMASPHRSIARTTRWRVSARSRSTLAG